MAVSRYGCSAEKKERPLAKSEARLVRLFTKRLRPICSCRCHLFVIEYFSVTITHWKITEILVVVKSAKSYQETATGKKELWAEGNKIGWRRHTSQALPQKLLHGMPHSRHGSNNVPHHILDGSFKKMTREGN
jgi:hypothetical protein